MTEDLKILDDIADNIRESRAVMDELSILGVSLGMSQKQIDEEVREAIMAHMDKVIEKRMQKILG
tara:strand:- start:368 stop:562 length:195 start_codon:yes stop_codon:yes gene_type:complete